MHRLGFNAEANAVIRLRFGSDKFLDVMEHLANEKRDIGSIQRVEISGCHSEAVKDSSPLGRRSASVP